MEPIYILGAGISGLAAAYSLKKKYHSVRILEKERVGGWIQDSFGPRTFVKERSSHLLTLIDELGLRDKIILASPEAKKRYLYYKGKMRTIPWHLWYEILCEPFRSSSSEEETVHNFFKRRFGPKTARLVGSALCQGIFAGDPHTLCVNAAFPQLKRCEEKHGSLLKALFHRKSKSTLFTLEGGIQTLIAALENKLKHDIIYETVERVHLHSDHAQINDHKARHVISALPSHAIGHLLQDQDLLAIPYASIQIASLTYESVPFAYPGFGVLFPENAEGILGAIFDSEIFPSENFCLTVMLRNSNLQQALEAVKNYLQISSQPLKADFLNLNHAIPQYTLGHMAKIERIQKRYQNTPLSLTGSYIAGPSVNDCIKQTFALLNSL